MGFVFLSFAIERILHGVAGGWQDQYAAVYGGINFLNFNMNANKRYEIKLETKEFTLFENSILLIETGLPTGSSLIQRNIRQNIIDGKLTNEISNQVDLAIECKKLLEDGKIKSLGLAINKSWQLKQRYSQNIQNEHIEKIINTAKEIGVWGCKLLGTGGGGYILGIIDINKMNVICDDLNRSNLIYHKVKIDQMGAIINS